MKKFSKKGVLLFAGAMAVCAFAMPSMASAASWAGAVHDTFTSTGIGFTGGGGGISASCTNASFTTSRDNAQVLTFTTGQFSGCNSIVAGSTCTTTMRPTRFPWRATAVTTTNIQIHDIVIDVTWANADGCLAPQSFTVTGTLTGGVWTGNAAGQRRLDFNHAHGMTSHVSGTSSPAFVVGSFVGPNTTVLD